MAVLITPDKHIKDIDVGPRPVEFDVATEAQGFFNSAFLLLETKRRELEKM